MTEKNETKEPLTRKVKVVVLSLGTGMANVIGLLAVMVMARILTKEDMAAYRQTLLAYAFVSPLIGLGIGQGIYYFLPPEKLRIRGRVVDAVTILAGMGLLFALFLALGGNQLLAMRFSNPQVAGLLLWMVPYSIITTPAARCPEVLVARDKVIQSSIFQVTRQLFIGIATVVPVFIWQTAEAPLIGNVVASSLFGLEAIRLMIKATPNDSAAPTREGMSEMLKFSIPLGLATMVGTISIQLDKIIVAMMCSPEDFAVYSLGAVEIPFLTVITGSITMVVLADMRKAVVDDRKMDALKLFRTMAEKTSLIIFPMALFLCVCAEPFIETLFSQKYTDSAQPFRLYLLKLPYRIVMFGSILMAFGDKGFILRRSITSLVLGCFVKVALVWQIGYLGAIIGAVIVAYIYVVPSSLIRVAQRVGVPWSETIPGAVLGKRLLMCIPVVVLSGLVVFFLDDQLPIVRLAVAGGLVGSYCLWWWNGELYSFAAVKNKIMSFRN